MNDVDGNCVNFNCLLRSRLIIIAQAIVEYEINLTASEHMCFESMYEHNDIIYTCVAANKKSTFRTPHHEINLKIESV